MRKNIVARMANSPSSSDFPPFSIRKRLLTDFIEVRVPVPVLFSSVQLEYPQVHECSFQSAFESALILEGGIDKFPFTKRAILVQLKYRPDCQENPSVAFSIEGCTWTTQGAQNRSPMEDQIDAESRARVPGYRGLLRVYFAMEDHTIGELYPQTHLQGLPGVLHRACIATVDHTKWVSRVQQFVRDGLVMRAEGETNRMMQLGKLKMRKGKWVWVQLTKSELLGFGYPSNFPGLLF